jgi:protein-tyrosine-phosphatase
MNKIRNILWVCLGNTARSPTAEYLARYYAQKYKLDLNFESAGFINAFPYMQPESRKYLDSKNINSSDFKPQVINRRLLEKQDLILTMEQSHVQDIIRNFKDIKDLDKKLFTLKQFNDELEDLDIIDPYYTSRSAYYKVLQIIDENVEKALKKIIKINEVT